MNKVKITSLNIKANKKNSRIILVAVAALFIVAIGVFIINYYKSDDKGNNDQGNNDCSGTWSPCSDACETADQRTFSVTTEQSGSGAPCPQAENCRPGEGECPIISSPDLNQEEDPSLQSSGEGQSSTGGDTITCQEWYNRPDNEPDILGIEITKNEICNVVEGTIFGDNMRILNTAPSITIDPNTFIPTIDPTVTENCCVVPDDSDQQRDLRDAIDQDLENAQINVETTNANCDVNNATIHSNGISDAENHEDGINFSNLLIPDALDDRNLFNLPSADQQNSQIISDGTTANLSDIFPRNPNAEYEYGPSQSQINGSYSYETDFQDLFPVTCNNGVLEGIDDWYPDLIQNTIYSDNNKYCKKGDLLYLEGTTPPQGSPKLLLNTGNKSLDRQINLFLDQNNINQTLSWEDVGLDTTTGENDINNYHCSEDDYTPRYRTTPETTMVNGQEITRQVFVTDPKCSPDGVQLPFECKNTCSLNPSDSNLVSDTNLDGGYRLKQKLDGSLYTIDELKTAIDQLNIVPGDDGDTQILNEYLECSDTYKPSDISVNITAGCSDQANTQKYIHLNGCNLRTCGNTLAHAAEQGNTMAVLGNTQISLSEGCGTEDDCRACLPETVQVHCNTWFQEPGGGGIDSFCGTDKLFAQQTGQFIQHNLPGENNVNPVDTCCSTNTMKSNADLIAIFDDTTRNKFCSDNYTFNTVWQNHTPPSDLNTTFSNLAGASGGDVELSQTTQDNILQKLRNGETVNGLVSPICKLTDDKKCESMAEDCPDGSFKMSNRYVSPDEIPDATKCCYPSDAQFTLDPSYNMFHEFINNTIESPESMNQLLNSNNEFKYNNSGTIDGSESSGLTEIISTYNNRVCNGQPWTLHIDDPGGNNYYRVAGCDQTCTLSDDFLAGTASNYIGGDAKDRIAPGLLAAPSSAGNDGGLIYDVIVGGRPDDSSNNVDLASVNQEILHVNSQTGQTYCGVRGTADTGGGGTICNQIPVLDQQGAADDAQCNTTPGCSTLYRCLDAATQGGSEYTYHKSPLTPDIESSNCSPISCISDSGESVFIDNYERIKTVASIGHGDLQGNSDLVYGNKDNSFHGLQLSCTAGNTTSLNGCDVLLTQDSASNPSDPTVPPVLYHSSIFNDPEHRNTAKNCANFIDYETIDYTKTTGISEVTDLTSSDIRRSNIVTREQVETDPSLINTIGEPIPSIEDSKALCTNENNAIFYPHKENQACAPGYHPIEDHINLGGSFFHECNASGSEAECHTEYCEWVPSDVNDGSGTCKNIATARCKEIVEPGTTESFYNGFTHIYQTGPDSEFGEKEHTDQCQVSEGYYAKSHYDRIEVTDPNGIYKSVDDPQIKPLSNKMNCNSDADLFDANHKLTKPLPDQTSGNDNNLRFRLNTTDDLDIIKRGLTKQSPGSDSDDTNICLPGYILQLENTDTVSTEPVQNFVCSPCPSMQNMKEGHLSLCGLDSTEMAGSTFSELTNYLTGDIQSSNIIPNNPSGNNHVKFCKENYIYIYNADNSIGSCEPKSCSIVDSDGSIANDPTFAGLINPTPIPDSYYTYGSEKIIKYNSINPDLTFSLDISLDDSENIGYFINDQFKFSNTEISCSGDKNALNSACSLEESCSITDQSSQQCLTTDNINIPWSSDPLTILDSIPLNSDTNTVPISNPCNSWIDPTTSYITKEHCVNSTIPVLQSDGTIQEVSTGNLWIDYSNYGNDPDTGNPLESDREGFSNLHNAVEESASGRSGICLSIPKNKDDVEMSEIIKLGISPSKRASEYSDTIKFTVLVKLLEEINNSFNPDGALWNARNVLDNYLTEITTYIDTKTQENIKILGPPGKSCSDACSMVNSECDPVSATEWFDDPNHPKHSCASLNDFLNIANESIHNLVRISDSTDYKDPNWGINRIAAPDTDGFDQNGQWTGFEGCGGGCVYNTDTGHADCENQPYYRLTTDSNANHIYHYKQPTCRTKVENHDNSLSKNLLLNDQIMSKLREGKPKDRYISYAQQTHRNSSYVTKKCYEDLINDETLPYINSKSEYYKFCCQAMSAPQYLEYVTPRIRYHGDGWSTPGCDQNCVNRKKEIVQSYIDQIGESIPDPKPENWEYGIMVREPEGDPTTVQPTWCFDSETGGVHDCCAKDPSAALLTYYSDFEHPSPHDIPENWYFYNHGLANNQRIHCPQPTSLGSGGCRSMREPSLPPVAYSEKYYNSANVHYSITTPFGVAIDPISGMYDTNKCRSDSVTYDNPYPEDVPDFPRCDLAKDGPWLDDIEAASYMRGADLGSSRAAQDFESSKHKYNYIYNMPPGGNSTYYNSDNNGQIYQNEQLLSAYPNGAGQEKSGISCRFSASPVPEQIDVHPIFDNPSETYDCNYYEEAGQRLCFCNNVTEGIIKDFILIKRVFYMCSNADIFTDLPKFTEDENVILSSLLDKYHNEKIRNPSNNMVDYFTTLVDSDYDPYSKPQVITMIDKLLNSLLKIISDGLSDTSTEDARGWGEYGNFVTPITATIKDIDNNNQTINLYGNVPYEGNAPSPGGPSKNVKDEWIDNVNTCGWIMDLSSISNTDSKENIVNKYSRVCNRLTYTGDETTDNLYKNPPVEKFNELSLEGIELNSTVDFIKQTLDRNDIPPYYYKLQDEANDIRLFNNNWNLKESDTRSLCTTKKSNDNDFLVCSYNLMKNDPINDLNHAKDSLIQPYLGYLDKDITGDINEFNNTAPYISGGRELRYQGSDGVNYQTDPRTDIQPDDISINRYSFFDSDTSTILDYQPKTHPFVNDDHPGGRPANTINTLQGNSVTLNKLRDYNVSSQESINEFHLPTTEIYCGWKNHVWVHTSDSIAQNEPIEDHILQNYNYCLGQIGRTAGFSGESVTDNYGLRLGKNNGVGGDTRIIPDTCFPRTKEEQDKLDQSIPMDHAKLFTKHHPVTGHYPSTEVYFGNEQDKDEITDIRKNILINSKGFCAPCPHNTILGVDSNGKLRCQELDANTYGFNPQYSLEEVYDINSTNLAATKRVFNDPKYNQVFNGDHGVGDDNQLLLGDAIYNSDGRQKVGATDKERFYYMYLEDQECGGQAHNGYFDPGRSDQGGPCYPPNTGVQSIIDYHYYVTDCPSGWTNSQPSLDNGTYNPSTRIPAEQVAFNNNWWEWDLHSDKQNVRTKTCGSGDGWGYSTPNSATHNSMQGKCGAGRVRNTDSPYDCIDITNNKVWRDKSMEETKTADYGQDEISSEPAGIQNTNSVQKNHKFMYKCGELISKSSECDDTCTYGGASAWAGYQGFGCRDANCDTTGINRCHQPSGSGNYSTGYTLSNDTDGGVTGLGSPDCNDYRCSTTTDG